MNLDISRSELIIHAVRMVAPRRLIFLILKKLEKNRKHIGLRSC